MTDDATIATAPLPDEVEFTAEKPEAEEPEVDEKEEAEAEPDADEDSGEDEEKAEEEEPDKEKAEDDTEDKKPRRRSRRDRRMAQLEQETAELKRMLEDLQKPPEPTEPREEDFTDYSEYLKARDDYSRAQGKREASEEVKQQQTQAEQQRQAEDIAKRAAKMQEQGNAKYSDFWDVALNSESFDPSPEVAKVILESDMAADVAYYLGSHPDEADRVETMTPTQAAREIGHIEARLSANPKPKTPSAPEPVKPIGPGKDTPSRSLEDVSYSEYRKRRLKGK